MGVVFGKVNCGSIQLTEKLIALKALLHPLFGNNIMTHIDGNKELHCS